MFFLKMMALFGFGISITTSAFAQYTLAVFGDSLSNGYKLPKNESFCAQLEQALQDKGYIVNVLNASKNGETTTGGIQRIDTLLKQKPDGVILELGVNDSFKNVSIEKIQSNLKKLITTFKNEKIPVLLVGMKTIPNKPILYQKQFEKIYLNLAQMHRLDFYPFFMDGLFDSSVVWDLNLQNENLIPHDIHPNKKGVSIMVQKILPTVERFLKKQGHPPINQTK